MPSMRIWRNHCQQKEKQCWGGERGLGSAALGNKGRGGSIKDQCWESGGRARLRRGFSLRNRQPPPLGGTRVRGNESDRGPAGTQNRAAKALVHLLLSGGTGLADVTVLSLSMCVTCPFGTRLPTCHCRRLLGERMQGVAVPKSMGTKRLFAPAHVSGGEPAGRTGVSDWQSRGGWASEEGGTLRGVPLFAPQKLVLD